MALQFWFHPLSSYCHKVLLALYDRDIAFEPIVLNLGDPEQAARFEAVWPMKKMPIFVDTNTGETVMEASIMLEWLDARSPDGPRLIPSETASALKVRFWDRFFDIYLHTPMQAIVADRLRDEATRDPIAVEEARSRIRRAYAYVEANLPEDGWIAGDFSLADCAASPALFYAHTIEPIGPDQPKTLAYRERLMRRPGYARALREAAPFFRYFPMDPKPDIAILDRPAP